MSGVWDKVGGEARSKYRYGVRVKGEAVKHSTMQTVHKYCAAWVCLSKFNC